MSTGFVFLEKTTPIITGTFKDLNGNPITIETLKLTIFDSKTRAIINNRNLDDLTAEIGTLVDTNGNLTFALDETDMTISRKVNPGEIVEHTIRFDYTWNSGSRSNSTVILLSIKNLDYK